MVNFSSFEDKTLVWTSWNDGFKTPNVIVTKDSRSRREKAGLLMKKKKRKKSDYHANCFISTDSNLLDGVCNNGQAKCKDSHSDDFDK